MTTKDKLYKETLIRVGGQEMQGVNRLLEGGHTGIAEKHTVNKLMAYVRNLELQIGINIPNPDKAPILDNMIKINMGGNVYYQSR